MFAQQLVLPAFALFSVAVAQTNTICAVPTATINAVADVAKYTDCPQLNSVLIGAGVEPNAQIALNGPTRILGSLNAQNAPLISLTSTSITSIAAAFTLSNLTTLSNLQFDALTTVKSISWSSLPLLGALNFASVISQADSVVITNTFLSSLSGINLKSVQLLDINNNNRLTTFETQVANISQGINIADNGNALDISFPNLIWANNMTFRNVKSLTTPSLAVVNGSLIFVNNGFSGYTAPNLTKIGNFQTSQGSFAFVGNNKLSNISFPAVTSIGGGFQVANNTAMTDVTMAKLSQVGGAIDLSGNFSTPSAPALTNVVGALNIQSTAQLDCATYWDTLKGKSIVQGKSNCKSTADPTTLDGTSGGSGTGTTTGSGAKPSTSKGAAASYGINEAAAGITVIGGLLSMLL